MRRIAFFGNCQAAALADIYKKYLAPRYGDEVRLIRSWAPISDVDLDWLGSCDLILEQLSTLPFASDIEAYRSGIPIRPFPTVCMGFIWPFGNEPHPQNVSLPHRPEGAYEMNSGDRYLNDQIRRGIAPDAALAKYLSDTKALSPERIDRYYELYMSQQQVLDDRSGFNFAATMEDRFRAEQLFAAPYHPCLAFSREYAAAILGRYLTSTVDAQSAVHGVARSPFAANELPIHPLIATRLNLTWAQAGRAYIGITGEKTNYSEYFQNYVNFSWNEKLSEVLSQAKSADETQLDSMSARLMSCPGALDSATARVALGDLARRSGDKDRAIEHYKCATLIEGPCTDTLASLASCYMDNDQYDLARPVLELALKLSPGNSEALHVFSRFLSHEGRIKEAVEAARTASLADPKHPWYQINWIEMQLIDAQYASAERLINQSIAKWPDLDALPILRIRALQVQRKYEEGATLAERLLEEQPLNLQVHAMLASMLLEQERPDLAEHRLRSVLATKLDAELYNLMGLALGKQERWIEARDAVTAAVREAPNHPYYAAHLSGLCERLGDLDEAERWAARTIELRPLDSTFHSNMKRIRERKHA